MTLRWSLLPLSLLIACGPRVPDEPTQDEVDAASELDCTACTLELCARGDTPQALLECLEQDPPPTQENPAYTCMDAHGRHDDGAWQRVVECSIDACVCED